MSTVKYFYRIKTPTATESGYGEEWNWKPFDIGYIEAPSKAEAKKLLEEQFGVSMCQRSKRDDIGTKNVFMVQLYEPNDYYDKLWNAEHTCEVCGTAYTKLLRDKAHDFAYIKGEVCSELCEDKASKARTESINAMFDFNGIHNAVIYRIWHKETQQSYIGKTTQAFTLRWYQHFYQSKNTKFHEAIQNSRLIDWSFEIVESFGFTGKDIVRGDDNGYAKLLADREQYWIEHYKALTLGLNSVKAAGGEELNPFNRDVDPDDLFGLELELPEGV